MKRAILIAALLVATTAARGQQVQPQLWHSDAKDSAEWVVERYLRLMNIEGLERDSILYMESTIVYASAPTDTAILKRWFLPPNRFRSEMWHKDTLLEGLYTDGKKLHREINNTNLVYWMHITESRYYDQVRPYDFRGPLYSWRADGAELTYQGVWKMEGSDVYRIYVETPDRYNSYYLFEKGSGLLFLEQTTEGHSAYSNHQAKAFAGLHGIHEYLPIGKALLPSVESYQTKDDMLIYRTTYRYVPLDMRIFTED